MTARGPAIKSGFTKMKDAEDQEKNYRYRGMGCPNCKKPLPRFVDI